jgi:hypothetical protein
VQTPSPYWNRYQMRLAVALLFTKLLIIPLLAASGIPVGEYKERVHKATIALDSLSAIDETVESASRQDIELVTIRNIREMLPAQLEVEESGRTILADHYWLHSELEEIESRGATSDALLAEDLAKITGRLKAISDRLNSDSSAASSQTVADRKRLDTILSGLEKERGSKGDAFSRVKEKIAFYLEQIRDWLRQLFPAMPQFDNRPNDTVNLIVNICLFSIAGAVFIYLCWKLFPLLRRKREKPVDREIHVLGEKIESGKGSKDLLAEAEQFALKGDYREAIRKAYIAKIVELGARRLFKVGRNKTNRDYLRAVEGRLNLYKELELMTSIFENHWYGRVPASIEAWNQFRNIYNRAAAS